MKTAYRATTWAVAAALALAGAATAQKDKIHLTDGTVIDSATVTAFDLRNVEFRRRGQTEQRSTDTVANLEIEKVKEAYKRAYASANTADGPGNFLQTAEKLTEPFLKQFGYVEAARLFLKNSQFSEAFQVLEQLAEACPDSGFLPMLYRVKLDYYLSQGKDKAGDAMTVAKKYSTAAQTQGFPAGFGVEAKYFEVLAQAAAGGLTGERLRSQLQAIATEASRFPDVASRCKVQIAETLRSENKLEDAEREYQEMLDNDSTPVDVRAEAWLGLGYCQFAKGTPANREPYRDALLAFLRVYVETPNAPAGTIAESLYMGAQAAEKWDGSDAGRMARSLRSRLTRDYPDSAWSKR